MLSVVDDAMLLKPWPSHRCTHLALQLVRNFASYLCDLRTPASLTLLLTPFLQDNEHQFRVASEETAF